MCGILGYNGEQNAKEILLNGLKRLEYRGYDSTGIAVYENNETHIYRSPGRVSELEKKLENTPLKGILGIGHTRWATHGPPTENNAHPHQAGSITLVHNGIIENYLELQEKVLRANRKLVTDTDSEIIAHLIDIEIEKNVPLEKAIQNVTATLEGSYSIVLYCEKYPNLLVGFKKNIPLMAAKTEKDFFLTSDIQGILPYTKEVIYFEDGDIVLCSKNSLTILDSNLKPKNYSITTLDWSSEESSKLGYDHFMLKEIYEQPIAISQTIENNLSHAKKCIHLHELDSMKEVLLNINRIYIAACGTAKHAGLVGKYYLEKFSKIPVEVDFASEFRYRKPLLDSKTLLIVISQSGETADTLGALREAKKSNIQTLAICNVRNSTLAREADHVLYTNAGPEIGVASTKAFTTQLTLLYMLSVHLGDLKQTLSETESKQLTTELLKLPLLVETSLKVYDEVALLSKQFEETKTYFYVGRNILYPIALEGALKLKEISYLHAEGYPAGELKHGPIALLDENVVCFVLSPSEKDSIYLKLASNLQEIKARKTKVIGIGSKNLQLEKVCDSFIKIPESSWALTPILESIPIQMIAYTIAKLKDTDIDKPRNLAKSVTVE